MDNSSAVSRIDLIVRFGTMSPDWTGLPLEMKYNILLHLPYESLSFIEDDYFWRLYCTKRGYDKIFKFISFKDTCRLRSSLDKICHINEQDDVFDWPPTDKKRIKRLREE